MALRAGGISRVFAEHPTHEWHFRIYDNNTGFQSVGVDGGWALRDQNDILYLDWTGPSIEITYLPSGSANINALLIDYIGTFSYDSRVALIEHTPVAVDEGEKIIYTGIELEFETDNYPE